MAELKLVAKTNRAPADELADVREKIRALKQREDEIRAAMLAGEVGLFGDEFEASISKSKREGINTQLMKRELGLAFLHNGAPGTVATSRAVPTLAVGPRTFVTTGQMRCPECGAKCWRNEVDVDVGIISDEWKCEECAWDEDQAFPMSATNWEDFLRTDDR
jgi:hypothetical protein